MIRKFLRLSLFCTLLGGGYTLVEATPLASVKAVGMAQCVVAHPLDTISAVYNPASIGWMGNRIDMGLNIAYTRPRFVVKGNAFPVGMNGHYQSSRRWGFVPEFGMSYQYGILTFGIIAYNQQGESLKFNHTFPVFGRSDVRSDYQDNVLSAPVAISLPCGHTFGMSVDFNYQWARLTGFENFDVPGVTVHPGHVTNNGWDTSRGWGVKFGWLWEISPKLTFGISYQTRVYTSSFSKYDGFLVKGDIDSPATTRFGLAWKPICGLAICVQAEYEEDGRIRSLHNSVDKLQPGVLLGAPNAPGFGWRSVWYYRVGVDYDINEQFSVRAGYRHAQPYFNRHNTTLNTLNMQVITDYICVGGSWRYGCHWEFSGYYCYGVSRKVNGKNSVPAVFGGGEVNLKSDQHIVGLAAGYNY